MLFPLPAQYIKDTDGFPPPIPGAQMAKFGSFTYQTTSGTVLFYLPYQAEIVGWTLVVTTAFNAGTTNTLDFGTTGALTQFATTLAGGSAAVITAGFAVSQFATRLVGGGLGGSTPVTVRYNQTGTAASAGAGLLICEYIVR